MSYVNIWIIKRIPILSTHFLRLELKLLRLLVRGEYERTKQPKQFKVFFFMEKFLGNHIVAQTIPHVSNDRQHKRISQLSPPHCFQIKFKVDSRKENKGREKFVSSCERKKVSTRRIAFQIELQRVSETILIMDVSILNFSMLFVFEMKNLFSPSCCCSLS